MARLTAVCRDLWTPPDLSRNTTPCDWLFGFGWLFVGMAIYTTPSLAFSVGLLKLAGWLITSGSLVQRIQRRLWPFDGSLTRGLNRVAAAVRPATVTVHAQVVPSRFEGFRRVTTSLALACLLSILIGAGLFSWLMHLAAAFAAFFRPH